MIAPWCRFHRHLPIPDPHRTLSQKLGGHCAYDGITGNGEALRRLREAVQRMWQKWLSRRSWAGGLCWEAFNALRRYPLPPALVVHSVCRR
jgi:RNA-directed DNA polymerase